MILTYDMTFENHSFIPAGVENGLSNQQETKIFVKV